MPLLFKQRNDRTKTDQTSQMSQTNARLGLSSVVKKQQLEDEKRLIQACIVTPEEALTLLHANPNGLTEDEVEERRSEFGANELQRSKHLSFFADILSDSKVRSSFSSWS